MSFLSNDPYRWRPRFSHLVPPLPGLLLGAVLLSAAAADSGEFEDQFTRARNLDREQQWQAAVGAYVGLLQAFPDADTAAPARSALEDMLLSMRDNPIALEGVGDDGMRAALEAAADLQIFEAHLLIGDWLRTRGESEEAFQWFRRAATQGHPPAMIQVGLMYSNGDGVEQDMEKASSWLRPANVKGSAIGKTLLAECFLYGKGVTRNPELAVTLLEQAAEMEQPARALDMLGTCYHKGWGVEADAKRAAKLYRDACESGFANACANLGVLYMKGDGVDPDPEAAVALFRQGSERGNAQSMYFYAAACWEGLGADRNADEAREWFLRAAQLGNPQAIQWCRDHDLTW